MRCFKDDERGVVTADIYVDDLKYNAKRHLAALVGCDKVKTKYPIARAFFSYRDTSNDRDIVNIKKEE